MQYTFLEAASGQRLSKRHCPKNGFTAYPNVKNVTSHEHQAPANNAGLAALENLIRSHGDKGHCLLKGSLKTKLTNESRARKTDKISYSNLLVLDIDGIRIKNHTNPKQFTSTEIGKLAKTVLREFPPEIQDASFIAQASASLGLKGDKVSLHIFMLLETAMPGERIKLWLQSVNYSSDLFASQLELSANGHSLKYPLDISVADNSKLIFISPPTFEDASYDPFSSSDERVVRISGVTETVELATLLKDISPELCKHQEVHHKNKLRQALGLNPRKEKITNAAVNNKLEDILTNPDRMSITIADDTAPPYIRCNVNGGDSNAYYFSIKDMTYMYNFKGEPIWSIEEADPDFYKTLHEHFATDLAETGLAKFPVVLRDFYTDHYYNGLFDPNLNQFDSTFPLTKTQPNSMEGFMRSHGRSKPDFIPDAKVEFDPTSTKDAVNLKQIPYYVNTFRKTEYMLDKTPHERLTLGDSPKISQACPLIYKLILHIVGGQTLETEHFINWLAYIFQTKKKTKTSWVFQGVPGTGKGIFYSKVLRPLFGPEHVPMRTLENIEEQYNDFLRTAMFLIVDEFHMASANKGLIRIADKLKGGITEDTTPIRAMRTDSAEAPSFTNYIFLTNRVDAVNIEEGDRRYNIAPRQEQKLEMVYPEVVSQIDGIKKELITFAAILRNFKYSQSLVNYPIANNAKAQMAQITMSVEQEFFAAIKAGNLEFFLDVLDISITNVMQGQEISTAQRFVKNWCVESQLQYSIVPFENLRLVYGVWSEERMTIRNFKKKADRAGIVEDRKRPAGASRKINAVRGALIEWRIDDENFKIVKDKYFDEKDLKLLAQV